MKSKKLSCNKILVLFSIVVVSVLMAGCNGGALPIVNIFSASPSTINQGESSTLTWNVYEADTVTITSIGTVDSSGSISVSPGVTTVYTLTATNSTGSVTATATINVVQALPVHNLTKNTYYNTIQAALNDADNNNTIEVADGTYDETIGFPYGKKVILQSVNGTSSTTIRGDDNSSTIYLSNSLSGTTIEGFTITHAFGLIGGGIRNDLGNLTIYNCTVSNNYGSGIENHGTLTITGASTVSSNTGVYDGGGILNHGTLTITGASTISDNTAYWSGGGIYNHGTLTITGAGTISGNNTYSNGGGIFNWGTLTITASTISGNTADSSGGGIYIDSLSTTITASTISGNSADDGGGIYIDVSSFIPTIGGSSSAEKNTICGNYKSGNSPSLDQQIRGSSMWTSVDLYDAYKDTNYIYTNCEF